MLITKARNIYLQQVGHVLGLVCWFFCLFVSRIIEKLLPDFHETWWKDEAMAKKEPLKFWRNPNYGVDTNYLSLSQNDRWVVLPSLREQLWSSKINIE